MLWSDWGSICADCTCLVQSDRAAGLGLVGRPLSQHKKQRHIDTGLHLEDGGHGGVRHIEADQRFCVFLQHYNIMLDGWGVYARHKDL